MGQLRDRMAEDLKLAGYSPSTQRIYLHYAKNLAKHFRRFPTDLGDHEIRTFLLHLLDRNLSHNSYVEPRLPIVLSGCEIRQPVPRRIAACRLAERIL